MRLTGPRNESPDDLRSAIAGRFGDAEDAPSPGNSPEPRDEDSPDESWGFAIGNTTSNAAKQACRTESKQFLNAYASYQAKNSARVPAGTNTAAIASTLFSDGDLTSGTLTYLDAAQGGTPPGSSTWIFTQSSGTVDPGGC